MGTVSGNWLFYHDDHRVTHDKETQKQNFSDRMKEKIDSPSGRREYSKRLGTIEPVFGNITTNKGMNRFTLRGQDKVNSQWLMFCLVHNIEKPKGWLILSLQKECLQCRGNILFFLCSNS